MTNKTARASSVIPISAYAPVQLERPLAVYGKTFKVHISTGLTLSPNTVSLAVFDVSLLQLMRNDKERHDRTLSDFWRGVSGKNKLSNTTQKRVHNLFEKFLPTDILSAALAGNEPVTSMPWQSDWEASLIGLGEPDEHDLFQLVSRLAGLDRIAFSAKHMGEAEGVALLEKYVGQPVEGWKRHNPNILLSIAFLVDISLQTLAWLEWRSNNRAPIAEKIISPTVLPLLISGRKPLGHWLATLQDKSSCKNLNEFSSWLLRQGVQRHDFDVSHHLLKKWSSGLIPAKAGQSILKPFSSRPDAKHLEVNFYVARFLTFLADLVMAGTRGQAPSWKTTQEQLSRRYEELYWLEEKRWKIP